MTPLPPHDRVDLRASVEHPDGITYEVRADGEIVAIGVPVHVMTMDDHMLELDVGDPGSPVPSLPDGHLQVVWDAHRGGHSNDAEQARYLLGAGVLLALLVLVLVGLRTTAEERQ